MTPQDFMYWLQGFFELTNNDDLPKGIGGAGVFTPWQVECVLKHSALVAANHKRGDAMLKIDTVLEMMRDKVVDPKVGTEKVRAIVAHAFEHVIDPKAGGPEEQARLNRIHGAPSGVTYRC
jgi:hypothetical protein